MKDIPKEVLWVFYIQNYVKYVGKDIYNKVEEIINKYPTYFPWETKYNSIPKEVHEAYWREKRPHKDEPIVCTGGIMSQIKERGYIEIKPIDVKEWFESLRQMEKDEEERKRKNKGLWDKYYKKYNLKFRE